MAAISTCPSFGSRIFKFIQIILILIVMIVFLFFVILPVKIYTFVIRVWVQRYKPELGKMLTALSSFFATDDLFNDPVATLVPVICIDGIMDYNFSMKRIEAVVDKKWFPELTQTLTSWMGFYFWKKNNHFSLKNHVTFIDEPISEKDYEQIAKNLARKPYREDRPLWEMVFYNNFQTTENLSNGEIVNKRQTILYMRFHHSLTDGFALLKLANELSDGQNGVIETNKNVCTRSSIGRFLFQVKVVLFGIYPLIESFVDSAELSPWKRNHKETHREYISDGVCDIPFDEIRQTAKSLQVTITSLMFASYFGAVRNLMLEKRVEIPKKFAVVYAIPIPEQSHPGSFTNHMSAALLQAPLNCSNSLQRLLECQRMFQSLKESPVPYLQHLIVELLGSFIARKFPVKTVSSALLINFPGPRVTPTFFGLPVSSFELCGKIPLGFCSTLLTVHMFGGKFSIRHSFDTCIYNDDKVAQNLMQLILKELEIFKRVAKIVSPDLIN